MSGDEVAVCFAVLDEFLARSSRQTRKRGTVEVSAELETPDAITPMPMPHAYSDAGGWISRYRRLA